MATFTELEPALEALTEADDEVPSDVWARLWEEWEPFGLETAGD